MTGGVQRKKNGCLRGERVEGILQTQWFVFPGISLNAAWTRRLTFLEGRKPIPQPPIPNFRLRTGLFSLLNRFPSFFLPLLNSNLFRKRVVSASGTRPQFVYGQILFCQPFPCYRMLNGDEICDSFHIGYFLRPPPLGNSWLTFPSESSLEMWLFVRASHYYVDLRSHISPRERLEMRRRVNKNGFHRRESDVLQNIIWLSHFLQRESINCASNKFIVMKLSVLGRIQAIFLVRAVFFSKVFRPYDNE